MTVALEGNAKKSTRTLDAVKHEMGTKNKRRNISGLSPVELEGDIDYLLHVDHELPMEWYTRLDAVKSDLAHLIVTHADAAVRRVLQEMKYTVAKELEDNIGSAIVNMPQFSEPYEIEAVAADPAPDMKQGDTDGPSMKDLLA